MVRIRAAASSMASGMPSRTRQTRATAAALSSVTVNPDRTARAWIDQEPNRVVAEHLAAVEVLRRQAERIDWPAPPRR